MSIQDIANYVRQTPGNTNPSVITSMVKSEVGEYVEEASNEALRKLGIKPGQRIATVELEEDEGSTFAEYEGKLNLVVGQTYDVQTNSGTYRAVCKGVDEGEGAYFRYLGNADIFEDVSAPGDHYCIGEGTNLQGNLYVTAMDRNHGKSISISIPDTGIDPKYFPEGGVGWSESGMVLTWDGDTSGAIDTGEFIMVKIHDKNVDLTKVVSISVRSAAKPEEGENVLGPEMFGFIEAEEGVSGVFISFENVNNATLGVVSIPAGVEGLDEGVYIQTNVPLVYISKITFAETIHPIDPKYLPESYAEKVADKALEKLGIREEKSLKAIMDSGQIELPFEIKDGKGELFEDIEDSAAIALWREISNGDTCKVVFDGKEYILPATVGPSSENLADTDIHIGGDGYPFYFWHTIAESNANMIFFIEAYDEKPAHSFAVYLQTTTTTPISDKYLPEPVVIDLNELGIMGKIQDLIELNGGRTTLTIDPDKLWNKVRNAPQIICKFPLQEEYSSGNSFNGYLTGWYHVPATRIDHIELLYDAVSVTLTFIAMNHLARLTLSVMSFGLTVDENNHIIYPDTTTVLLDLYPLTAAPGNN